MEAQINLLKSTGGNYLRYTMSSRDSGDVWPYKKMHQAFFDLQKPNDSYWDLFETFLSLTASKDIIVQVEIWATYDFYGSYWKNNPYNPKNNINYDSVRSLLPEMHDFSGWQKLIPFFQSVPALDDNKLLLNIQR